ncbi:MAG: S26 family signal peptidase [Planctomycetia bacterium]|nr:S26 family signal peptidase [Planctomycetia bacterium]
MSKKEKDTSQSGKPQEVEKKEEGVFREVVESIAIAFIVAFLFRTFLAEMFVIPTGSMAPTLCGAHKDYACPKCGNPCQVGASEEFRSALKIDFPTCPNCGYTISFMEELSRGIKYPTYSGDRILAGKYPYRLTDPQRWDVALFLCPGNAGMNYIKRIIGLPGESIKIWGGDIFVGKYDPESQDSSEQKYRIARKPAEKILATMIPVYDNNYQSKELRDYGWPSRWSSSHMPFFFQGQDLSANKNTAGTEWEESEDGRVFTFSPEKGQTAYGQLEYRHYLPRWLDWNLVNGQKMSENIRRNIRARLITDMTGYNTGRSYDPQKKSGYIYEEGGISKYYTPQPDTSMYGFHWVGDLIAECTVNVRSREQGARFSVGLIKGGFPFWCDINLETGEVELSIPSEPDHGQTPAADSEKVVRLNRDSRKRKGESELAEENRVPSRGSENSGEEYLDKGGFEEASSFAWVGSRAGHTESERNLGTVTFPPAPEVVGHRESVVESEVMVQEIASGEWETMKVEKTVNLPIYKYSEKTEPEYLARGDGGGLRASEFLSGKEGDFYTPRGKTPMHGVGTYHVRFANVDNQLHLWINNQLISFDLPTAYCDLGITQPQVEDLRPVQIKCCCAKVQVSDLKIFRDIYYIAENIRRSEFSDFQSPEEIFFEAGLAHPNQQWEFYTDPKYWRAFQNRRSMEYFLEKGQYFLLGDNSAASSDCRVWYGVPYVRKELLLGEGYYVYWPHPWQGIIPNFPKMRKIR